MNRKNTHKTLAIWYIIVACVAIALLIGWEKFNYDTTYIPLTILFGNVSASQILSIVVVGVDMLFLSHIVMRAFVWKSEWESIVDAFFEDRISTGMSIAWLFTTIVDMFFTWFWGAGRMEITGVQSGVPDIVHNYLGVFPLMIAILSWTAQAALIITTTRSIQLLVAIISGNVSIPRIPQPVQQSSIPVAHVAHMSHPNVPKPKPIPTFRNKP